MSYRTESPRWHHRDQYPSSHSSWDESSSRPECEDFRGSRGELQGVPDYLEEDHYYRPEASPPARATPRSQPYATPSQQLVLSKFEYWRLPRHDQRKYDEWYARNLGWDQQPPPSRTDSESSSYDYQSDREPSRSTPHPEAFPPRQAACDQTPGEALEAFSRTLTVQESIWWQRFIVPLIDQGKKISPAVRDACLDRFRDRFRQETPTYARRRPPGDPIGRSAPPPTGQRLTAPPRSVPNPRKTSESRPKDAKGVRVKCNRRRCFNCGSPNHMIRNCDRPDRQIETRLKDTKGARVDINRGRCFNCNSPDHIARYCDSHQDRVHNTRRPPPSPSPLPTRGGARN
jgi:Zinc knuckle